MLDVLTVRYLSSVQTAESKDLQNSMKYFFIHSTIYQSDTYFNVESHLVEHLLSYVTMTSLEGISSPFKASMISLTLNLTKGESKNSKAGKMTHATI